MQNDSGITRRKPLVKENDPKGQNMAESLIRPRAFSMDENITPQNMPGHHSARNNIPSILGQAQYAQPDMTDSRNFPEIRNAIIAASADRRLSSQPNLRTPTATAPTKRGRPRDAGPNLSVCCVCSRLANFLCSGCQAVYYCTVQCQVLHTVFTLFMLLTVLQSNHWLDHYNNCVGSRT